MSSVSHIPTPGPLQLTATGWQEFIFKWTNYEIALSLDKESDERRVATLLSVVGDDALRKFRTFKFEKKEDSTTPTKVISAFENYCLPCKNVIFDRFEFLARKKESAESAAEYVASLRELSKSCEYEKMTPDTIVDELIRDKLIFSSTSAIRNSLRREKQEDLTLDKVLRIIQGFEKASQEEQTLGENASQTIAAVFRSNQRFVSNSNHLKTQSNAQFSYDRAQCGYCGGHPHRRENCPAKSAQCRKCARKGHFQKVCRSKNFPKPKKANNASTVTTVEREKEWMISSVNTIDRRTGIIKCYRVGRHEVNFLVDTGSDVNTLPLWIYKLITNDNHLQNLRRTVQHVTCYNHSSVTCYGEVDLEVSDSSSSHVLSFLVLDRMVDPLIGVKSAVQLKLLSLASAVFSDDCQVNVSSLDNSSSQITALSLREEFSDVFSDNVGDVGVTHHITVDPKVPPVQHAQRRIQQPLLGPVKEKLDSLVRQGIITPVTEPTRWVNSFVPVLKKNGDIRICIDPKDLNVAIRREHYTMPILSELTPKLKSAKLFSKFDVKNGFLHIKLDEDSSMLTTFNSPNGRYRWNRLPFGLKSAPEVFQRTMHELLHDLDGTVVIADDVLVYGSSEEEHDRRVRAFLMRCREKDLHLNFHKLVFRQAKVKYMGHVLTDQGIQPDPEKVQGIMEMPAPSNVAELRTFLGSINYLAQFLPNLAALTNPLRSLLHKGMEFNWSSHCGEVFEEVKKLITSTPIMSYFDVTKPVIIQCDASQKGVGASLIQDGHPVAFASRSLTTTEEKYAQIEKEMLAIVVACEKFDNFIYGLPSITIHSDHKPLESIFQKSINDAPRRLQRMLLRLQKYNVNLVYRPGKDMWIADLLSRLYSRQSKQSSVFALKLEVEPFDAELAISATALQKLKQASANDPDIYDMLTGKFPSSYKSVKDDIATKNGLAFKSGRLIVPVELRKEALQQLHIGHKGICSTQRLARETFYWPGITRDIQQVVSNCNVCAAIGPSQPKEPLCHHEIPGAP